MQRLVSVAISLVERFTSELVKAYIDGGCFALVCSRRDRGSPLEFQRRKNNNLICQYTIYILDETPLQMIKGRFNVIYRRK